MRQCFSFKRFFIGILFFNVFMVSAAQAGIISTKQEIAIGQSAVKQIETQYKLVDDPVLQERVSKIGRRIAAVSDRPNLPYTFKVLDVDEVNAMALPGGFVYINKGLTDCMLTDDELAGIIGHEIGHIVKRHSMAQLEKTLGMAVLLGGLFGGREIGAEMIALNAIAAGYSRSDEREADKLGFEQSVKAGYNPYGSLIGLMKLAELNPDVKSDLFSDHPEAAERIKLMQQYLEKKHIYPTIIEDTSTASAQVIDGSWLLPPIKISAEKLTPCYRAYLTAGRLYQIAQQPDYSADHYILDTDGSNMSIYYDDNLLITLMPEDALAAGTTLEELTKNYVETLKKWRIHN
ncbi:M48 family metallopeptidase [Propionispira raffinosivorans]|uniref:M48 family metallopeptidase n=1 Tax=Propionispira raffinosivorans TaxID=86959 RepID=UPI00036FF425|nr:M48 family metallopeptidase [Propionispira raffinosivorans]